MTTRKHTCAPFTPEDVAICRMGGTGRATMIAFSAIETGRLMAETEQRIRAKRTEHLVRAYEERHTARSAAADTFDARLRELLDNYAEGLRAIDGLPEWKARECASDHASNTASLWRLRN